MEPILETEVGMGPSLQAIHKRPGFSLEGGGGADWELKGLLPDEERKGHCQADADDNPPDDRRSETAGQAGATIAAEDGPQCHDQCHFPGH
jgi:hypothetical protein